MNYQDLEDDVLRELCRMSDPSFMYLYSETTDEPLREAEIMDGFQPFGLIAKYKNQSHLIMIINEERSVVYRSSYTRLHNKWCKIFDSTKYSKNTQYQKAVELAIKLGKLKATLNRKYYDDDSWYGYTLHNYRRITHRINIINTLLCEHFATDKELDTLGVDVSADFRLWRDINMTPDKWKCVFDNSGKEFHPKLQLQIEKLFIPVLLRLE